MFVAILLLSNVQASSLSGVSYFDFSYVDRQGGVFDMTRTYLNYTNKLSYNMNYNVTLDVARNSEDGKLSAYLRNAELRMQLFVEAFLLLLLLHFS